MQVVELASDAAEEFIRQQPVSVILFFTHNDARIGTILHEFSAVAESFPEHVSFGMVDLSLKENAGLLEEHVIVVTPTLVYYRFGVPEGEDIGGYDILRHLYHSWIAGYVCTDTGLKLVR